MTDQSEHTSAGRTAAGETKSATGLFSDALNHVTSLVRGEINLVRAELSESASRAAMALGLIVGAVVLILVALNVLAAALVDAIAALGIDTGWAALIVGVVFAVIAAGMLRKGTNDLKAARLAPARTPKSLQKDAYAVKESLNG